MTIDARIKNRIEELITLGEQVLSTRREPPSNSIGFDATVDAELSRQWATQCQNILIRVFGEQSPHYRNFSEQLVKLTFHPAKSALGVLRAAHDDYVGGYLFDIRRLVEADVFDDMLEQAAHLLDSGYYQASVVIAGAVLEDALRKMCVQSHVKLLNRPKLDKMNADLAKVGAYNKLTQKRITALADIRNSAAHGNWEDFGEADAKDLVQWIYNFIEARYS